VSVSSVSWHAGQGPLRGLPALTCRHIDNLLAHLQCTPVMEYAIFLYIRYAFWIITLLFLPAISED